MLQFFSASTRMANPQRAFMQCPAGRNCHHDAGHPAPETLISCRRRRKAAAALG